MSPAMQVKLLRVLQERRVRPVGATDETVVDTRVIAATNRDLASMVTTGTFREDLYYRISVIPIELPPLRERAEDISELANHFVQKFCGPTGRELSISESAMRLLERYSWPGNVRELEHTIERAVALESTNSIEPERHPEKISNYNPFRVAEAMEFPDEGIKHHGPLGPAGKKRTYSRRFGAHRVIRHNAAELLRLSVRIAQAYYSTSMAFAA
jgi:transcriptional regulator with GAF, ATPase, and Fis domain